MDLPNSNYFVWHYSQALPSFIQSRVQKFSESLAYFSLSSLLKNLFAPYKRLTLAKTATGNIIERYLDKISFDIISRSIGAVVRLMFIVIGIFGLIFIVLLDLLLIVSYLLPVFSLPKYLDLKRQFVTDRDMKDPQIMLKKLSQTPYLKTISLFFNNDFQKLWDEKIEQNLSLPLNPTVENITTFLFKNVPQFTKYLDSISIKYSDFGILGIAVSHNLNPLKIKAVSPFGGFLSFGYTNTLNQFSTPIYPAKVLPSEKSQGIVANIEKIIERTQNNNVLLIGEPGTGRHTTLNYLAQAVYDPKNKGLFSKRLLMLDTVAIAGQGKNLPQIKSIFENILEEAKTAGGIILVIDEIDRIVTTQDGRIDISEVIVSILKDFALPVIGITTTDNFNQFIRPNTNFLKYFEKIEIEEPDYSQTLGILIDKVLSGLDKTKVTPTLQALCEIVTRTQTLIPDEKQPEKSLTLLGDVIASAQSSNKNKVDIEVVQEILSSQTKVPIGKITESEAKKLKDLETVLHQRIIGQNQAIIDIAKAMRRARSGIENGKRPIGSFIFLGPTGVGKTETAKALAETYFGSEEKMVRLDMSEYQGPNSLERLIGDSKTKTPGQLSTLIREHPFGLLLVDEFEKAPNLVHNLFLQILDEGFLTDSFGKKVSFNNVIIIATSNAAAEFIRQSIKDKNNITSRQLVDYVLKKGLFTPELLNRFDGVIVYSPLKDDEAIKVSALMLKNLASQLKETKNITLEITPQLAQIVAQKGYDQEFGARPIRRLIQDKIEDGIAKMIIDGTAKNGDKIPAATLSKFVA